MESHEKTCADGALLLGYAAGTLTSEESALVESHVERCSRCRNVMRENEELARAYRLLPQEQGAHPSPEELTHLAEGLPEESELTQVRTHVAECDECLEIVSVLEKVHAETSAPGLVETLREAAQRLASGWSAGGAGLSAWLRSPVPAYLLALLLLYPAYLGLFKVDPLEERLRELESPTLLPQPVPVESEARRGVGTASLRIDRRPHFVVLTFFVPIASERYGYVVELSREGERLFFDSDARSYDGVGTFALLLPAASLEPGEHQLRVEEQEQPSGRIVNVVSFSFTISN